MMVSRSRCAAAQRNSDGITSTVARKPQPSTIRAATSHSPFVAAAPRKLPQAATINPASTVRRAFTSENRNPSGMPSAAPSTLYAPMADAATNNDRSKSCCNCGSAIATLLT
jgi:hypothetical protein